MSINKDALNIIESLGLEPHPEGGFFARTYKSRHMIKSTDEKKYSGEARSAGSSIYYLLDGHNFSAWHRIKSDEIWHYYKGSPVMLYTIDQQGKLMTYLLGDPTQTAGARFQICIEANVWFAAENVDKNTYSLIGCTVSPGFEYHDFTLADRDELQREYPEHGNIVEKFTRV